MPLAKLNLLKLKENLPLLVVFLSSLCLCIWLAADFYQATDPEITNTLPDTGRSLTSTEKPGTSPANGASVQSATDQAMEKLRLGCITKEAKKQKTKISTKASYLRISGQFCDEKVEQVHIVPQSSKNLPEAFFNKQRQNFDSEVIALLPGKNTLILRIVRGTAKKKKGKAKQSTEDLKIEVERTS